MKIQTACWVIASVVFGFTVGRVTVPQHAMYEVPYSGKAYILLTYPDNDGVTVNTDRVVLFGAPRGFSGGTDIVVQKDSKLSYVILD